MPYRGTYKKEIKKVPREYLDRKHGKIKIIL